MNSLLCINKTGGRINVYNRNNESQVVGYLNDREAFVVTDTNGSNRTYIQFLDGSGNFVEGVLKEDGGTYNTPFYTEYPAKKEYIEGNQYLLFKMRKSMPVYNSDRSRWGTVAANCYVATDRNLCGANMKNCVFIKYVQSSSGAWVRAGFPSDGYGFVDTGIASDSSVNGMALYGSW